MPAGKGARARAETKALDKAAYAMYIAGRSVEDIAGEQGWPVSTTYDRIRRGRSMEIINFKDMTAEELLQEALDSAREVYEQAMALVPAEGSKPLPVALAARKRIDDILGTEAPKKVDVTSNGETLQLDVSAVVRALAHLDDDDEG